MKKKLLFLALALVVIACGLIFVFFVLPNLSFSSRVTINGNEFARYNANGFIKEVDAILTDFYTEANKIDVNELPGSENKQLISNSIEYVNKIKALLDKEKVVEGNGVEEFEKALSDWVEGYSTLLSEDLSELAGLVDENKSVADADVARFNELITRSNNRAATLTEELSAAFIKFQEAN